MTTMIPTNQVVLKMPPSIAFVVAATCQKAYRDLAKQPDYGVLRQVLREVVEEIREDLNGKDEPELGKYLDGGWIDASPEFWDEVLAAAPDTAAAVGLAVHAFALEYAISILSEQRLLGDSFHGCRVELFRRGLSWFQGVDESTADSILGRLMAAMNEAIDGMEVDVEQRRDPP